MAPKRATFYAYGSDTICEEAKKFITDAGILLTIRNLADKPFTVREVKELIGHIEIRHFLNSASAEYAKLGISEKLEDLDEAYKIISENNSILKRPIITTARLITIGCDKKKLSEMLQISNSSGQVDDFKGNLKNSKYVTRRTTTKSSPETTQVTPVETPVKSEVVKTKTSSVRASK